MGTLRLAMHRPQQRRTPGEMHSHGCLPGAIRAAQRCLAVPYAATMNYGSLEKESGQQTPFTNPHASGTAGMRNTSRVVDSYRECNTARPDV